MPAYEFDEIGWCIPGQRRFRETHIFGYEVFRSGLEIREIASTAAGDLDFLANRAIMFDYDDSTAALSSLDGTHETGGPTADDDDVEVHRIYDVRSWRSTNAINA